MASHWHKGYWIDIRRSRFLTMQLLQGTSCATRFTTASQPKILRRKQACWVIVSQQVSFQKGGQPNSCLLSVLLSWL